MLVTDGIPQENQVTYEMATYCASRSAPIYSLACRSEKPGWGKGAPALRAEALKAECGSSFAGVSDCTMRNVMYDIKSMGCAGCDAVRRLQQPPHGTAPPLQRSLLQPAARVASVATAAGTSCLACLSARGARRSR